ncbi:hypothetical protein BDF22DRAFT_666264 [Syncephalis plumigaleata]|nr:hypothetical protein BDF22DRAFT_666264 [Syncephalis plumigaleata]
MEAEYNHDGWDDRNDANYGNNDAPSTGLRRYSPSPSPQRKLSRSPSRSRGGHSPSDNYYNGSTDRRSSTRRSRSRSRSPNRSNGRRERSFYRSRSRSRSRGRFNRGSFDRRDRRGSSPSNGSFMPQAPPRRARENPEPTNVLGIFNLDYYTNEHELRDIYEPFGGLERVVIVMDRRNQRSRGFAFVYFNDVNNAARAREATNGKVINDRGIRVDFSVTKEAHQPTPGMYMGEPDRSSSGRGGGGGGGSRYSSRYGGGSGGSGSAYRPRRRSRSRSHSRSRGRYGDRSYYRDAASPTSANHRYRSRSRSR